MKEEGGGGISEKRWPYDPSITAEWASLQPELVQLIADYVLSTSGVDEYMAMRAVCPSWRSAVAKPSPHAAVADLRYLPRQWVLLHGADDDEGRPLFLNVSPGRFRRLRSQVLRDYIFLGDRERPHAARLFNPLTGDMLPFAAPIPPEPWVDTAVTGSEPTIIFCFPPARGEYLYSSWERGGDAVYSADPISQLRVVKFHDAASSEEGLFYLCSMVTYAGNVYVLSAGGTLSKIVWTGGHCYAEPILETDMKCTGGLIESAGKLVLFKELETFQVFSVDVKRKILEPIESLGSSALFLSYFKTMVVDADKLPSIDGNCIYSIVGINKFDSMYMRYDLSDGKKEYITGSQVGQDVHGVESGTIYEGPLSLAQVLLTPYPDMIDQLARLYAFSV